MTVSDGASTISERSAGTDRRPYPIKVAFSDYDRTRPLLDGRVKAKGLSLTASTAPIADFCLRPVYEEYDAAEMSFSWYVMAHDRGEPLTALPIFPLRMSVWAYVYVRADSPITKPRQLAGKKIGCEDVYRATVNLWLRGLFKEHYGLAPEQVTWVKDKDEDIGYVIPDGIKVEVRKGTQAEQNLKDGEVEAIFCVRTPKSFREGEPWIRRLFPDCQNEAQSFVRRTGIVPITHVVVVNRRLIDREPWIAESLYRAFVEAQQQADQINQIEPKRLSLLNSVYIVEQQRAAYGSNPYVHGVEPNRKIIETFVRYAHDQNYISRRIPIDELFVPSTLGL